MSKSRNLFLFCFLFAFQAMSEIPTIKSFVGKPLIELTDGKKIDVIKGKKIEQSFSVKTAINQQIKLELGFDFYVVVFPESSLKVEGFYIDKKTYKVKRLEFVTGKFYLKNGSNMAEDLNVIYESDFFIWKNTEKSNQREFFLDVNLSAAQARFCAGESGIRASVFDHEVVKVLKYQEGYEFQGVLQDGKLAFDLLLEGRKIPKGEWKKSFTCDFQQILKQITDLETKEKVDNEKAIQQKKATLKKIKAEYDKSLCHEPNGQFNQCLWKMTNQKCMRFRCDGQGNWSDEQQLPKSKKYQCETKPKVGNCDY